MKISTINSEGEREIKLEVKKEVFDLTTHSTHLVTVIRRERKPAAATWATLSDGPLSYFSFHPVIHDWYNKGRGMCYPVYGMVHIKESLLLIGKSNPCGGNGFHLLLSEWSFTICLTPYNRK